MTGTLTAIWRILIWGLAALLLVAIWISWQDRQVAENSGGDTTSAEETVADEGTAQEPRPGATPEVSDSDPAEAAVEDAPDDTDLELVTDGAEEGDAQEGEADDALDFVVDPDTPVENDTEADADSTTEQDQ